MKLLANRAMKRVLALFLTVIAAFGVFGMHEPARKVVAAAGEDKTYTKVTTAPADWSGEYLIVYEEGNLIFDGSLAKLDAVGNTQEVTITDSSITTDSSYAFTIATVEGGGYTIQSASGQYISKSKDGNGMDTAEAANTISLNDDNTVNIVGAGNAHLRYNATSGQTRFRYYKSSTYTNQKAIALYKLKPASVDEGCAHVWSEWVVKEATCTEAGTKTRTCTATCKGVETEETSPALGHIEKVVTVDATCSAPGSTTTTCERGCGLIDDNVEIPQLSHSYDANGVCSVCGETKVIYTEVTDVAALGDGSKIIIANKENAVAMGSQSGTYRNQVSVTVSDTTIVDPQDVAVVTLEQDGAAFYLKVEDGYLTFSGTSNRVYTETDKADADPWTITVKDGVTTIVPQTIDNAERRLQYNSNDTRFACYKGTQKEITIYQRPLTKDEAIDIMKAQTTKASFKLSYNGTTLDENKVALRFGTEMSASVYNALTNAGATFGIQIVADNGKSISGECTPAKYDNKEVYAFAGVFNVGSAYTTVFTAKAYVKIGEDVYYVAAISHSVNTLAAQYLTDGLYESNAVLNFLATATAPTAAQE